MISPRPGAEQIVGDSEKNVPYENNSALDEKILDTPLILYLTINIILGRCGFSFLYNPNLALENMSLYYVQSVYYAPIEIHKNNL